MRDRVGVRDRVGSLDRVRRLARSGVGRTIRLAIADPKGPVVSDESVRETPEPVAIDLVNRMGVIDDEACIELVRSTPIGRIGFMSDGWPLVLPVNFAWYEGSIVFRTIEGQKLAAAAERQPVCFEVDRWDATTRSGWSVVIRGTANEVTDWAEIAHLENIGLAPWSKEKWRPLWVRVDPSEISGRVLR
jgi:nitroimidazol reductase NimA-like FMN-containing flavoprotein (pyridoxamine 5'-phosphate oxidase superfamily)